MLWYAKHWRVYISFIRIGAIAFCMGEWQRRRYGHCVPFVVGRYDARLSASASVCHSWIHVKLGLLLCITKIKVIDSFFLRSRWLPLFNWMALPVYHACAPSVCCTFCVAAVWMAKCRYAIHFFCLRAVFFSSALSDLLFCCCCCVRPVLAHNEIWNNEIMNEMFGSCVWSVAYF